MKVSIKPSIFINNIEELSKIKSSIIINKFIYLDRFFSILNEDIIGYIITDSYSSIGFQFNTDVFNYILKQKNISVINIYMYSLYYCYNGGNLYYYYADLFHGLIDTYPFLLVYTDEKYLYNVDEDSILMSRFENQYKEFNDFITSQQLLKKLK